MDKQEQQNDSNIQDFETKADGCENMPAETAQVDAGKKPDDPYWANRIPPKVFSSACMALGAIFLIAGALTWIFSKSAVVGVVILGCSGIMFNIGITGWRENRKKADE